MIFLTLKSGGILEKEVLDAFEKKHYKEDVSSQAICYLFYPIEIEKGVLLKDLFLLINRNLEIFDSIFGNWCKEWVQEGLKEGKKLENLSHVYLEHFFTISQIGDKQILDGTEAPECHLAGVDFGKYDIGSVSAADLAQLPLILKQEGMLWKNSEISFNKCTFTLGQVIQGFLGELSWHGSPTDTSNFWDEIDRRLEDSK